MRLSRIAIRGGLALAFVVSIGVIAFAFNTVGTERAEFWAVFAGALAVLTSVISAWTGQRSLELEQDAREPYPYPTVDTESRYGLVQLHLRNMGGSAAHEINLEWDEPLLDSEGNEVVFTEQEDAPDIPVLLPGESVRVMIDGSVQFFPNVEDANYTGVVHFKDASGRHYSHEFFLSAERHRKSLYYEQEEPRLTTSCRMSPTSWETSLKSSNGSVNCWKGTRTECCYNTTLLPTKGCG